MTCNLTYLTWLLWSYIIGKNIDWSCGMLSLQYSVHLPLQRQGEKCAARQKFSMGTWSNAQLHVAAQSPLRQLLSGFGEELFKKPIKPLINDKKPFRQSLKPTSFPLHYELPIVSCYIPDVPVFNNDQLCSLLFK